MSTFLTEMYGSNVAENKKIDESEVIDVGPEIYQHGMIKDVKFGEKSFSVIDPRLVGQLDSLIKKLQRRIAVLENDVKTLQSRSSRTETVLRETRDELSTKVGYRD